MSALLPVFERLSFYQELIANFTGGDLTPDEFEKRYLTAFGQENIHLPEPLFNALNELFLDVEDYCSDPSLRDERDIDAQELRRRALVTLDCLAQIRHSFLP